MRKNEFFTVIGMCALLYTVTVVILLTLLLLPGMACTVETNSLKAAIASYSNNLECGSNGCNFVGRKLIFWRPGLKPRIVMDNAIPDEIVSVVASEVAEFGITVTKGIINPNVLPDDGVIRVRVNPNLPQQGITRRGAAYMIEKPNYWEAYRGDVEIRLTGATTQELIAVILHEAAGHALGLDHSEGSHQWTVQNGVQVSYNYPLNRIPIMYPNNFPSDGYLQHEDKVFIREALSIPSPFAFGSVRGIANMQGAPAKGMIISLISLTDQELNISAPVDPLGNGSGEWFFNTVVPGKYYIKIHSQLCRFGGSGSSVGAYDCSDAPIEGFRWWTGTGWSKDNSKRVKINVVAGNSLFIQSRMKGN